MIRLTGKAREFADACYDMNSIDELNVTKVADSTDCKEWNITSAEWHLAISVAQEELMAL